MDCRLEIFDHGKVGTSHEEYSLVTSYFLLESRGMYYAWILYRDKDGGGLVRSRLSTDCFLSSLSRVTKRRVVKSCKT